MPREAVGAGAELEVALCQSCIYGAGRGLIERSCDNINKTGWHTCAGYRIRGEGGGRKERNIHSRRNEAFHPLGIYVFLKQERQVVWHLRETSWKEYFDDYFMYVLYTLIISTIDE